MNNFELLVFSHMMKTAGTSLNKQLIGQYGSKMHIVPGGLQMSDTHYNEIELKKDIQKLNGKLKLIAGHPIRPFIDYGDMNNKMNWFTFMREPKARFVSHYLHDYEWTNKFGHKRHMDMKDKTIIEWNNLENYSNYQTKFIEE